MESGASNGEPQTLGRSIGVLSGSALVSGLMIGSGIFSTPGLTLMLMGSAPATTLMWVLGALITFCGAASYIELGSMFTKSGGDQLYLDSAFRKPLGLIGFVFTFVCVEPASIAANAVVFGEYVFYAALGPKADITNPYIIEHLGWLERAVGLVGVTFAFGIQLFSVKWALRAQTAFTWVKMMVLGLISITGLVVLSGVTSIPRSPLWAEGFKGPTSAQQVCSTLFRVLWAYDGFKSLFFCLGELKNPRRNVIVCTASGIGMVTVLYVLTIVSYFTVISFDEAIASQEVLAGLWGLKVFGSTFGQIIIPVAVAISCLGSAAAAVFPFSRVIIETAHIGYIPLGHLWGHIHPKWGTPVYGLLLGYVLTLVYLLAPPPGEAFGLLVDIVGYPNWMFTGLVLVGLIYLRYTAPGLERPFRVWLPLTYVFITVAIFLTVFPFVPPLDGHILSKSGVPYFTAPLVAVFIMLLGIPTWYFQYYQKIQDAGGIVEDEKPTQ
ncbi:amino acid/polyamine transporter I [Dimargaris cristalligena]|uniref:Amino acid/polyamine transporter I n=1 Tax=Dimargaris cristalligena TaxID=215637 RepID=A0A4P9ZZL3_9FUNG|nr:amino acid/polyamine transporter I [Dimargaris cristalligena]|eukprot:RKP39175.1 amino acid/polyamine transporter I [Dimargaris cristalligena]